MAFEPLRPSPGGDKSKPQPPAQVLKPNPPAVLQPKPNTGTIPLAAEQPKRAAGVPEAIKEGRLASLDAYRGFIMLMMASAGFGLAKVVERLKDSGVAAEEREYRVAAWFAHQFEHVPWQGGVFWDLIQPAFMFMVGVALPYSYARRAARGDSYFSRLLHTLVRCVVLVALGVFLANATGSPERPFTLFKFTNVLAQIGLGYVFAFLLVNQGAWVQGVVAALILAGTWYAFFQHPLPPENFDSTKVGLPPRTVTVVENGVAKEVPNPELDVYVLPGLKGHWSKNVNFASAQDQDLLNRFKRIKGPPRIEEGKMQEKEVVYARRAAAERTDDPFVFEPGGYATLNFVPAIVTMLIGLMIGESLRRTNKSSGDKLITLLIAGSGCLALGLALHFAGVCPIVKRIWTPSWALASGGAVIWMLALFYLVFDHWGWKRLAWPLAIVGMNSIVVYMLSQLLKPWTLRAIYTHLSLPYAQFTAWLSDKTGRSFSPALLGGSDDPYQPLYESLAVLAVFWLVCLWLWRQRITVRI